MREDYLGDSYDFVKRFWCESLGSIAPLYAHPEFVPEKFRDKYTKTTSIPILDLAVVPNRPFGILIDPDTGIPLPTDGVDGATASHASLPFMVQLIQNLRPHYIICFDQSYHRSRKLGRKGQLKKKTRFLRDKGIRSFYYVSQAPFLFMAEKSDVLRDIWDRLTSLGIPANRFERGDIA